MTLPEAAQEALDVQNACNLSGVAHSFSKVLSEAMWPAANELGEGTQWVNQHPISVLFVDKLVSLTGLDFLEAHVVDAYATCRKLAGEL